jgi:hypothetical protein
MAATRPSVTLPPCSETWQTDTDVALSLSSDWGAFAASMVQVATGGDYASILETPTFSTLCFLAARASGGSAPIGTAAGRALTVLADRVAISDRLVTWFAARRGLLSRHGAAALLTVLEVALDHAPLALLQQLPILEAVVADSTLAARELAVCLSGWTHRLPLDVATRFTTTLPNRGVGFMELLPGFLRDPRLVTHRAFRLAAVLGVQYSPDPDLAVTLLGQLSAYPGAAWMIWHHFSTTPHAIEVLNAMNCGPGAQCPFDADDLGALCRDPDHRVRAKALQLMALPTSHAGAGSAV